MFFSQNQKNKNLKHKSRKTKTEKPKSNILVFSFLFFGADRKTKKTDRKTKNNEIMFFSFGMVAKPKTVFELLVLWFFNFLISKLPKPKNRQNHTVVCKRVCVCVF